MMNMGTEAQYESILMFFQNRDHSVRIGRVPEHLNVLVPVVAKVHMSLRQEMLVSVALKNSLNPIDHGCSHIGVSEILIEWVHAVQRDDHRVITQLVNVVSTSHPCGFDCLVSYDMFISWDSFEQDFPEFLVIICLVCSQGCLVMVDNIIIAEDGQDRYIWEGCDDGCDCFLHRILHLFPVCGRFIQGNGKTVLAKITH